MTEYRYHRMAHNGELWQRPHSGRLGATHGDYVAETGFGHEDWNFAQDLWSDGKLHLYLRQAPRKETRNEKFNIVLGAYYDGMHHVVGFAEDVDYSIAQLSPETRRRRALELINLDTEGQLGGDYKGKNKNDMTTLIRNDEGGYWAAVEPGKLYILNSPVPLQTGLFKVPSPQYILYKLSEDDYVSIVSFCKEAYEERPEDANSDFKEGRVIRRIHSARERNQRLIQAAKSKFIQLHGSLYCEACGLEPSTFYSDSELGGKIIEAHHNVPLSTYTAQSTTNINDIRMLCPSCHRAIHTSKDWLTVDDLRKAIG